MAPAAVGERGERDSVERRKSGGSHVNACAGLEGGRVTCYAEGL